jgi:hypothetical protein
MAERLDLHRLLARFRDWEEKPLRDSVWADHCSVITKVGAKSPTLFGNPHGLSIDLSDTEGQHSLNNVIGEHMHRHPDSDLAVVLIDEKSFKEASR